MIYHWILVIRWDEKNYKSIEIDAGFQKYLIKLTNQRQSLQKKNQILLLYVW